MNVLRARRGQAIIASLLLVTIIILIAGGMVDLYRLQEARNWAYYAAEAAALDGAATGRDLGTVYTVGASRIDPVTGHDAARQALQAALARRGVTGATYQIRVLEWGGSVANFPPSPHADMWNASDWVSVEPAVGVYLVVPVETFLMGLVSGNAPVAVHVFASAGVYTR